MSNPQLVQNKVTVYFDGLCHLCSREIRHYQTMKGADNLAFVDITGPSFNAAHEGLDPHEIHKNMHVRDREGKIHLGVGAFVCIWEQLPALRFLVPIARFYPVRVILNLLYKGFATVRPLLPRKSCETSPYCEIREKK